MKKLILMLLFYMPIFADLKMIDSIKADFIQIITENNKKTITYEGVMLAKAPYYALWEYVKPVLKKVYVIEDSVVVIEPDLEQAIFTKIEGNIDFIALLKSAKKEPNGKYKAKVLDQEYLISTNKDGIPVKIEFTDKLENKIEITLSNQQIDTIPDKSPFLYEIPQGYDIIREK